jgi:photosystem II stability/assembly factor-like uncharacterized protein
MNRGLKTHSSTNKRNRSSRLRQFLIVFVLGLSALWALAGPAQAPDSPKRSRDSVHPDLPHERTQFRRLQEMDNNGEIPKNALTSALRQQGEQRQAASQSPHPTVAGVPIRLKNQSELATAGLEKSVWIPIGPYNIGGRTRSIVVHPKDTQRIWIGSVGGGVWYSNDGGNSFSPVDDFMSNLAVTCLVMDPADGDIIYAGTGEAFGGDEALGDAIRGDGIFWTTNGRKWSQLVSARGHAAFEYINRLAISTTGVLLVATQDGVIRSIDRDLRDDWAATSLTTPIAYVAFDPNDPNRAIAGGINSGGVVNAYYSENAGKTWSPSHHVGSWQNRVELTYAKTPQGSPSQRVYASVDTNSGQIWRSIDGGKSFSMRKSKTVKGALAYYLGDPTGDPHYDQGDYANTIWAGDEKMPDLIIVGGLDLWRSDDGGDTLRPISTWSDDSHISAHADHHAIVSDPKYDGDKNRRLYFSNDGGLFKTEDFLLLGSEPGPPFTKGWINMNHKYSVTQFYAAAANVRSGVIVAGAQDNGTLKYDPTGDAWSRGLQDGGGDGGWCAADANGTFYAEYVNLQIHRNTIPGDAFEYISGQYWDDKVINPDNSQGNWVWKADKYVISDAKNGSALFIAPFVLDPNSEDRMIAGGSSLWLTTNARAQNTQKAGPIWKKIKDPIGQTKREMISAITLSGKLNSETIWVGYANGNVYRSAGGTQDAPSWSNRLNEAQAGWPLRYCLSLTVDPRNPEIVYATFGGYTKGNIWMTTNRGLAWHAIGPTLPAAPVRSLTIHPRNSKYLYIGTEVGLFASEDGGQTWSPTTQGSDPKNQGPTNCSVEQLFWVGDTLFAVTHGRGIWKIDLSSVA